MEKLKINIGNLKDGEHLFEFSVLPEEVDIDTVKVKDKVSVLSKLYKSGNQITLNTEVSGKFELECDRCMENYIQDFSNTFEVIYKYDFKDADSEDIDKNDEIKFISPNTKFIELRNDIRDFVLLSVPMKKVPEVKDGTCSYCNKNIDEMLSTNVSNEMNPVWEKLIKVKTK